MSTKQPDPVPPKAGGLWARLLGLSTGSAAEESKPREPEADAELSKLAGASAPLPAIEDDFRTVETMQTLEVEPAPAEPLQLARTVASAELAPPSDAAAIVEAPPPLAQAVPAEPCPACGTLRKGVQEYCEDCGWMFSNSPVSDVRSPMSEVPLPGTGHQTPDIGLPVTPPFKVPGMRLKDRYEIVAPLSERQGIARFSGLDHTSSPPRAVVIVQAALPEVQDVILPVNENTLTGSEDDCMPTIEDTLMVALAPDEGVPPWPGIAWEQALLAKLNNSGLPSVVESFIDGSTEYLVEAVPEGQRLWDAWDDPAADSNTRYGWLQELAQTLKALHQAGAQCESLRPDNIVATRDGHAVLTDLGELLPLPVPPGTPIRASLYTAPELVLTPEKADGRADLYGFGALLYALEYLHHDLEEKDFERQFSPKLITDRYPDVHPGFFRLISKTFNRDPNSRFPTDEASKEDRTGFAELIHTLEVCRKTFDSVRLDIAAWTTTGMVRTGNEDVFSFLHGMESRQDELTEYAMVLLCDGMGGYEAGEVAAAMCLQAMRKYLLQQAMFTALAGFEPPAPGDFTIDGTKKTLLAALKYANKEVFTAARTPGKGRRGMGCTAECVYVDNRHVVVGHVGDSRTYHLHEGRLVQLTRDQTLVNRLVELGQLTPEEAENHPRKNELQQAIGGQPDVEPGLYHGLLQRGDWVLVCSDGLTNHIPAADLTMMLSREAMSAEDAARRLMNLVNLRGATDNATIVVIRAS
jgi:PPM family protein phosphatase